MEIKMKRMSVLLFLTLLLASCAGTSFTPTPTLPPTSEPPSTLPEPTDPTQLITATAGETFDIILPSNPSTGYHWEILGELDENIVQPVAQDYIAEEPVKPGSGGVDVWTFRAVNAGSTTIELGAFPPDEEPDPFETVIFSIQVE
jgi:inhibitor of cysteine peptidase